MMKNFLVRQNQGCRIAVSRLENGINVCRKWDDFRRLSERASGRKGERAYRRRAILRVSRLGSMRWRAMNASAGGGQQPHPGGVE
jgi:hypothetical protein